MRKFHRNIFHNRSAPDQLCIDQISSLYSSSVFFLWQRQLLVFGAAILSLLSQFWFWSDNDDYFDFDDDISANAKYSDLKFNFLKSDSPKRRIKKLKSIKKFNSIFKKFQRRAAATRRFHPLPVYALTSLFLNH